MKFSRRTRLSLVALLAVLLGLDALVKVWAYTSVFEPLVVFKTPFGINLLIEYVTNRGGAWGMLSSFHTPLLLVRIGVIIALLAHLVFSCSSRRTAICFTVILAGAMGNVIDCFLYGYVIDMIHFTFWGASYGIFNVADAMIFLGGGAVIIDQMLTKKVADAGT